MASKEEYTNVFYFKYPPVHQPEYIWVKRQFPNAANQNQKRTIRTFWQYEDLAFGSGPDGNSMCCPSLNIVNMFDKKGADGIYYPIDDPRSGYALDYAHKPFEDRDPRFYNNILYLEQLGDITLMDVPITLQPTKEEQPISTC